MEIDSYTFLIASVAGFIVIVFLFAVYFKSSVYFGNKKDGSKDVCDGEKCIPTSSLDY